MAPVEDVRLGVEEWARSCSRNLPPRATPALPGPTPFNHPPNADAPAQPATYES